MAIMTPVTMDKRGREPWPPIDAWCMRVAESAPVGPTMLYRVPADSGIATATDEEAGARFAGRATLTAFYTHRAGRESAKDRPDLELIYLSIRYHTFIYEQEIKTAFNSYRSNAIRIKSYVLYSKSIPPKTALARPAQKAVTMPALGVLPAAIDKAMDMGMLTSATVCQWRRIVRATLVSV